MPNSYAVQVEDGRVVASIVGNAAWAADTLGGVWVDTGEQPYGDRWIYVEGEFIRDKPYDDWVWDDDTQDFVPPVPQPEPVEHYIWYWVQDAGKWVSLHEDYTGPFPPVA